MSKKDLLLEVKKLTVRYAGPAGSALALQDYSLSLSPGKITALVGESGSGKSTAVMAILDLLANNAQLSGSIFYKGEKLKAGDHAAFQAVRGSEFGLIIQEPMSALNPLMRVGEQVLEAIRLRPDAGKIDHKEKLRRLLDEAGIKDIDRIAGSYPHKLSGGQLQRVMIAMALAQDPRILMADEPTTSLDLTVQRKIIKLLLKLRERRNMAIIMVSHDLALVSHVADHVQILRHGKIVEEGSAKEIIRNPKTDYTKILLSCSPGGHKPGSIIPIDFEGKNKKQAKALLARKIGEKPILRVSDLDFHYGGGLFHPPFPALEGVGFELLEGETIGIVGESGSGKSSLAKLLIGLLTPSRGRIDFMPTKNNPNGIAKKGQPPCQMVFQNSSGALNRGLRVFDIMKEPHQRILKTPEKYLRHGIIKNLEEVGLAETILARYPSQLSGGQRQRVNVARALAGNPRILVCDEAVSALDATVQAHILNLLMRIRVERGLSMVFISHDMEVVRHVSDKILVLDGGKVVDYGGSEKIFKAPTHHATVKLIKSMYSINTA